MRPALKFAAGAVWMCSVWLQFASAAEIRFVFPSSCTILIRGEIALGDDAAFFARVVEGVDKGCATFRIELSSTGGALDTAMKIGRQIRAIHASTTAPVKAKGGKCLLLGTRETEACTCASACFFIWASGSDRLGSEVYIHRPYFDPLRTLNYTAEAYAAVVRQSRLFLVEMDVPASVVDRMFDTPSTEASKLTNDEFDRMETAPYYAEFLIARCGADPIPRTKRELDALTSARKEDIGLYRDCTREVGRDLAAMSFDRFVAKFGPVYGHAGILAPERETLRWLMEQTPPLEPKQQ